MSYMSHEVLELRRLIAEKDKEMGDLNYCLRIAEQEVSELRTKIQEVTNV